ncbi:type 4 pilus major pilin [Ferrimonas marina]|uniref:Prepilin-type N-terminal cleavage/methylation domain-containing protein n=1 Tax=Ferrimonas marina TaxID=299255 RepID=A0A1M5TJK8_9GAMM|nr:type 4 pilus major pilin [Ferrimonas marina]SHH50861.1 prepilin-type N-terminal cleavage/methylation domain-containing protein [Ferrimonas marina]
MRKNYQRGFSLVELMMSFVIIGIFTAAVFVGYNQTNAASRIATETKNLNSLQSAVRGLFNSQGSYNGLTNQITRTSNLFPEDMLNPSDTTKIRHSWSPDGVDLTPITYQGQADQAFMIQYKDVPQKECVDLAKTVYPFFLATRVNSTPVTSVPLASTACNAAFNTLEFDAR